jgi:hypothetical protein
MAAAGLFAAPDAYWPMVLADLATQAAPLADALPACSRLVSRAMVPSVVSNQHLAGRLCRGVDCW